VIVWLTFQGGGFDGRRIELGVAEGRALLLGRSPRAALAFQEIDRTVSAAHAKLWVEAGALYLSDVGSRYGTFVNGRAISKTRLADGDRIQFGQRGPEARISLSGPHFLPARGPTEAADLGNLTLSDVNVTISRGLLVPLHEARTEVVDSEPPEADPAELALDLDALADTPPPAPPPVEEVDRRAATEELSLEPPPHPAPAPAPPAPGAGHGGFDVDAAQTGFSMQLPSLRELIDEQKRRMTE
jgi:predicted component of type VI protein secretion system